MRTLTSTLTFLLLFAFAFGASTVYGQAAKFGKISEEELKMSVYEKDTSAAAVILSDVGYSHSNIQMVLNWCLSARCASKS